MTTSSLLGELEVFVAQQLMVITGSLKYSLSQWSLVWHTVCGAPIMTLPPHNRAHHWSAAHCLLQTSKHGINQYKANDYFKSPGLMGKCLSPSS